MYDLHDSRDILRLQSTPGSGFDGANQWTLHSRRDGAGANGENVHYYACGSLQEIKQRMASRGTGFAASLTQVPEGEDYK